MDKLLKRIRGVFLQFLAPAYGSCGRCWTPWKYTKGHCTNFNNGGGGFPLCEDCWRLLTVGERLPYYRKLWKDWEKDGYIDYTWEEIENAVINENLPSQQKHY